MHRAALMEPECVFMMESRSALSVAAVRASG